MLFKNSISGLWCDFAVTFVPFYFHFLVIFLCLSWWFEGKIVLKGVTAWWLTQKLDTRLMALLSLHPPSSHSCLKSRSWVCVIDLTCYMLHVFLKIKQRYRRSGFSCTFHFRWSLHSKIPTPSSFLPLKHTKRNTNPFMSFLICPHPILNRVNPNKNGPLGALM